MPSLFCFGVCFPFIFIILDFIPFLFYPSLMSRHDSKQMMGQILIAQHHNPLELPSLAHIKQISPTSAKYFMLDFLCLKY
jgi:hypothetical protein